MFEKIKIYILALFAWLLAAAPAWGDGEAYFTEGAEALKAAVWRLAAFVPADEAAPYTVRRLEISGLPGLQPTTVTLKFDEPLNPWPLEISLSLQAEQGDPPLIFTMSDRRPFGGPNIQFSGLSPTLQRDMPESPPELFLKILTRVNERLMSARPLLEEPQWTEAGEGFSTARVRLLYGAREGLAELYLVRVEPERHVFLPWHENDFPESDAAAMAGWAERLPGALAIINAGQYYPDRSYMGLLRRDGVDLHDELHKSWKGFLVSEPLDNAPHGAPRAAIIDLETNMAEWRPEDYKNIMQSFMILDRLGRIRVKDSRNLAGRAAVGLDREGRIILIMTPAAVSLYDLALALKNSGLGLSEVLGLDGGFEAQLYSATDGEPLTAASYFSISEKKALFLPGYSPTLPAVLAVHPRVLNLVQD